MLYIRDRTSHRFVVAGRCPARIRSLLSEHLRPHHKTKLLFYPVIYRRLLFICIDQRLCSQRIAPLYGVQDISLMYPRRIILDIEQIFIQITGNSQSSKQTVSHVFGNRTLPFLDPRKLADCHQPLCQLFQIDLFLSAHPLQKFGKILI